MATLSAKEKLASNLDAFVSSSVTTTRGVLAGPMAAALASTSDALRQIMDGCFNALNLAPTTDTELAAGMVLLTVAVTQLLYFAFAGKRHRRDRKELKKELKQAEAQVRDALCS